MAALSYSSFTPKAHLFLQPRNLKIINCISVNQSTNQCTKASAAAVEEGLRVVFAAGGTGGHIYPAVAIAEELKALNPDTQVMFIGTATSMESTAVPSAGYSFSAIPAAPLGRPFLSLYNIFVLPYLLLKSLYKSLKTLQEFNPHVVIGTGGYVSFPICLAAAILGLKLVIQEQNSVPGVANWVLSLFADRVFVAFESSVARFLKKDKCLVLGNPVRLSLRNYVSKAVARRHFFPRVAEEKGKVVLILGGSLGANAVNIALYNLYHQLMNEREDLYLIWQTGVEAFDEMESLVRNHPRVILTPFLHSVDLAYAAADLIVSRAGAMTCSEILAAGKPCILIPSPNAAEGHQVKNAILMADLACSMVITEEELDSTTLRYAIEEIIDSEDLLAYMSEKALLAAKPNASADIAKHILSLVEMPNTKKEKGTLDG